MWPHCNRRTIKSMMMMIMMTMMLGVPQFFKSKARVLLLLDVRLFCRQGLDFVKELIEMLRKRCESCAPSLLAEFDAVVDTEDKHVGFIINERIINLPPQISPPSFDALRLLVSCALVCQQRCSQYVWLGGGPNFQEYISVHDHCSKLQLDDKVLQSTDWPHGTVCHQHYSHRTCRRAPSSGH